MRPNSAVLFFLAHGWGIGSPAADFLSRWDIEPEHRTLVKLTDNIPVLHIESNLASKTHKQNNYEEDYDYNAQQPHSVPPTKTEAQLEVVKNILPMKLHEAAENYD